MKRYLIVLLILSASVALFARSPLTFDERVKAQEAIERVYYNHRIWPKENPQPKPPFEKMVPKDVIEAKVTDYLKKCSALDQFWQRPIVASQLQEEMDRMAKGSKDPQTLSELFAALNNDPYLIAECLARPVLADRLVHNWYANDERFHSVTRAKAEEALETLTPEYFCSCPEGQYSKMTYRLEIEGRGQMENFSPEDNIVKLDEKEFARILAETPDEGKISGVIEENDSFVIVHTISKNEYEIEIESLGFSKESLGQWIKKKSLSINKSGEEADGSLYKSGYQYHFSDVKSESTARLEFDCVPAAGYWMTTSTGSDVPSPRYFHSAIWTGSEVIIWGGSTSTTTRTNTGGRYLLATDSWTPTSTGENVPSARYAQQAFWTGTVMLIWAGNGGSNTGARYNPVSDSWVPVSSGGPFVYGSVVWTGSEMIVWGGYWASGTFINTGARYNLVSDTWTPTSTGANVPAPRSNNSAVWTGTEMIVWGGFISESCPYYTNTGGRYNPLTDSWSVMSIGPNTPTGRSLNTTVWTGTEMIVWGGKYCDGTDDQLCNTGGRYSPSTDTWSSMSVGTNCPGKRIRHRAIWTNNEMIIWGGYGDNAAVFFNDGGRYFPLTNTWLATPLSGLVPSGRIHHTVVWAGDRAMIWGGGYPITNTGGILSYEPVYPACHNTAKDITVCAKSGVLIEWGTPLWGDGGSGTRSLDLMRDGVAIATGLSESTVSYADTSGATGVSYLYQVRANNGCGLSTTTSGETAADINDPQPPQSLQNNSSSDISSCSYSGVLIQWAAPLAWNDSGGTRTYEVLRNGIVISAGLSESTLSYTDMTGQHEISYFYQVKANNGCGLSTTTEGVSAADLLVPVPIGFANNLASDISGCSYSGVLVQWTAPSSWCDDGYGTRTYDVLRDGSIIASSLSESTYSFIDITGNFNTTYLYQVGANSGYGLNSTTSGAYGTDNSGMNPGEVPSLSWASTSLSWPAVSGITNYRLYRGLKADLATLKTSTDDGCIRYNGASTSITLSADDPSSQTGRFFWYLVTANDGSCEGTAGEGTGFLRDLSSSTTCP